MSKQRALQPKRPSRRPSKPVIRPSGVAWGAAQIGLVIDRSPTRPEGNVTGFMAYEFGQSGKWTEGRIRHDDWQAWLREKGVTVLGGDVDEAPQAYRRLPDVLQAHDGIVQVEHTL